MYMINSIITNDVKCFPRMKIPGILTYYLNLIKIEFKVPMVQRIVPLLMKIFFTFKDCHGLFCT